MLVLVLLMIAAVFAAPPGAAAAGEGRQGTVDMAFGDGGSVLAKGPMETAPSEFVAAAHGPSGRIVLELRRRTLQPGWVREVELRLANGAPDPSFGKDGRVVVEEGHGLATLADGSIVVGVDRCRDGGEGSVMALEPSGAAVAGFGGDGCSAALPFAPKFVAADARGRVLAVGPIEHCDPCHPEIPPLIEVAVARLLPDGSRDPSFGGDGVVRTLAEHVIDASAVDSRPAITGIAATGDGGVIASVGSALIRLDEGGAAVAGFGNGGVTPVQGDEAVLHLQPDGNTVVASTERVPDGRILVSRFGPDGRPDPSFGGGGTTALSLPAPEVRGIAATPGGAVLITGRRGGEEGCRPCTGAAIVARLTASGEPDPTYGKSGVIDLPLPPLRRIYPGPPNAHTLLVGGDGSALAAGTSQGEDAFAVALDPAGQPSTGFAQSGTLVERHEEPARLEATGLALGPKGELTVGTRRSTAPGLRSGFLLSFEPNGKQRPGPTGTGSVEPLSHGQVTPNGRGRVVIWGGENDHRTLRAAGPNGEPLPGYGKNGVASFPPGFIPKAVAPAPRGGVAVVGAIGPRAMGVYRLGPGGEPVRRFGRDGLARLVYPGGFAIAFDGLVERDGGVVLTGWVNGHVGAARLLPNGRLDRNFGHRGLVRGLHRTGTFGLLIAPWDHGVVIATMRKDLEVSAQGLIRLDRNGDLVRGFGRRGLASPAEERPPFALLTAGGRIVVVTDPSLERDHRGHGVKLRAYRPDGTIDRGFGHGGLIMYGRGRPRKHEFAAEAAVAQPDGGIVIAGTSYTRHDSRLKLVRFR